MTSNRSPTRTTLLLIPTQFEFRRLAQHRLLDLPGCQVEQCGFGPVAAAARTAQLVARIQPERVVLCGIAGAYAPDQFPVGSAITLGRVVIDGVGAGEGSTLQSAAQLGFTHFADSRAGQSAEVGDTIEFAGPGGPTLLTVCAASDSRQMAADRLARHPAAVAEDMEGFGVALACQLTGTELTIVRGASNVVGDRDIGGWAIGPALFAAADLAASLITKATSEAARDE